MVRWNTVHVHYLHDYTYFDAESFFWYLCESKIHSFLTTKPFLAAKLTHCTLHDIYTCTMYIQYRIYMFYTINTHVQYIEHCVHVHVHVYNYIHVHASHCIHVCILHGCVYTTQHVIKTPIIYMYMYMYKCTHKRLWIRKWVLTLKRFFMLYSHK